MNIDIKHDLLKAAISDKRTTNKNVQTTIDQTLVASTAQKSLGMDLQNESTENSGSTKKKAKQKAKPKTAIKEDQSKKASVPIERDPMKLLKIF